MQNQYSGICCIYKKIEFRKCIEIKQNVADMAAIHTYAENYRAPVSKEFLHFIFFNVKLVILSFYVQICGGENNSGSQLSFAQT